MSPKATRNTLLRLSKRTQVKTNIMTLYTRVQTIFSRKQKPTLEISAPFDLRLEPACLPGVSQDELSILREKAAASRIGIAEALPRSSSSMSSWNSRRPITARSHHANLPSRARW